MFFQYFSLSTLVLVCLINVISVESADKESIKKLMDDLMKNCQTKTGASDADIALLKEHKVPESKEGICMFHCFFESSNVMEGEKYNKEQLVTALTPLIDGDETKLAKLKEMAETCGKNLGSGDKCEQGRVLMQCTVDEGKKFGFEYPKSA